MKYVSLLGLGLTLSVSAQVSETAPLPAPTPGAFPQPAQTVTALRTDADLETLLGPIALYPDALIALILPASTQPADIVMAARFVEAKGTEDALVTQPWDDSVKALTHYPDVLRWLDQNLPWTQALGDSFSSQPIDTMNTVQRLRARARANGTLVDTPQQRVVQENASILIVPTQPSVVYVPVYDPTIVYVSQPVYVGRPYIYFRSSYPTGPWLSYSFNWGGGNLRVISQPYGGWTRPGYHYQPNTPVRVWTPPPRQNYQPIQPQIPRPTVNRPYQPGWNRQPGNPPRQTPGSSAAPRTIWQQPNNAPGTQLFNNTRPTTVPQSPNVQQPRPNTPNFVPLVPAQPRTSRNAPSAVNPSAPVSSPASVPASRAAVRTDNRPAPNVWQSAPQTAPQVNAQSTPRTITQTPQTPQSNAVYNERRQNRPARTAPATPVTAPTAAPTS